MCLLHANMLHVYISSGKLTLQDLCEVRGALYEARAKWYDIGIELKLSTGTLNAIREDFPRAADCLREICIHWLRCINPCPSWEALAKTLESPPVGEGHLAQQLRDKYSQGREETIVDIYRTPGPSLPGAHPTSQGQSQCIIVLPHTDSDGSR